MSILLAMMPFVALSVALFFKTQRLEKENWNLNRKIRDKDCHIFNLNGLIDAAQGWKNEIQAENFELRKKLRAIRNSYRKRKGRGEFSQINWP